MREFSEEFQLKSEVRQVGMDGYGWVWMWMKMKMKMNSGGVWVEWYDDRGERS